jgi:hypothetical protein
VNVTFLGKRNLADGIQGPQGGQISLHYPCGPFVITDVLVRGGRGEF